MRIIRRVFFATMALVICTLVSPVLLAVAQQDPARELYVVTYVDAFPPFAVEAAKSFEVMRDVARQNHFAIVEIWRNCRNLCSWSR